MERFDRTRAACVNHRGRPAAERDNGRWPIRLGEHAHGPPAERVLAQTRAHRPVVHRRRCRRPPHSPTPRSRPRAQRPRLAPAPGSAAPGRPTPTACRWASSTSTSARPTGSSTPLRADTRRGAHPARPTARPLGRSASLSLGLPPQSASLQGHDQPGDELARLRRGGRRRGTQAQPPRQPHCHLQPPLPRRVPGDTLDQPLRPGRCGRSACRSRWWTSTTSSR